jgi:hypothetical protein
MGTMGNGETRNEKRDLSQLAAEEAQHAEGTASSGQQRDKRRRFSIQRTQRTAISKYVQTQPRPA